MQSDDDSLRENGDPAEPMLNRRPSSVNYRAHMETQDRERVNSYTKQAGQNISGGICTVIFLLICILATKLENCGPDIKGLLWLAIQLKGALVIYYILAVCMVKGRVIGTTLFSIVNILIFLGMLVFYYHVIDLYYRSGNSCRNEMSWLWLGHFYLCIEAIMNFCTCCCLSCIISCVIGFFCVAARQQDAQRRNNLALSDLLLNAASFKLNPNDYRSAGDCPICLEEFKEGENIISLPCNDKHIFHAQCIGDWVKVNNNCPLCKAVVTKEAIEGIELPERQLLDDP